MASHNQLPAGGPPYAPQTASSGGVPQVIPDVPITSSFLLLYVMFFAIHLRIDIRNRHRGHKFIFSRAMLAFCVIRMATMSLRIVWACNRKNVSIGIAAQIFVYVGTVILFIMNWFFAQRITRAQHPRFGWSTPYRILQRGALVLLICCLLMLVTVALQSFFTLDKNIHRIDRNIQLAGLTYFALFSFAPNLILVVNALLPRYGKERIGEGNMTKNILILALAVTTLALGACFRAGTSWLNPTPLRAATPWYLSTTCFYVFSFTTEILVVILYAWTRFDLRFWVPDGAKKPGDYGGQHPRDSFTDHLDPSDMTLHMYQSDIFSDTRTLADSLRYGPSTLQMDEKTGAWKVKRSSRGSSTAASMSSRWSGFSGPGALSDSDIPAVPELPGMNGDRGSRVESIDALPRSQDGVQHDRNDTLSRLTGSGKDGVGGSVVSLKGVQESGVVDEPTSSKSVTQSGPDSDPLHSDIHKFDFDFNEPNESV